MKNIVIVGAGGFGREVFCYARDCISTGTNWRIKGFIDDNLNALDELDYTQKVIAKISDYLPQENDFFLCAIANPKIKKILTQKLLDKGAQFETLIHPTALVGQNVEIGKGSIICPRASITCDASIGDFVLINTASVCGHDSHVGSYSTISSFCDITGYCKLGESVFFASRVSMRPNSKVGDNSSVGIGSCVIMNIKPNTNAFGNPASEIHIR